MVPPREVTISIARSDKEVWQNYKESPFLSYKMKFADYKQS